MNLARSSAVIAAGTLASRGTGLIRTIVLVAAIGQIGQASDAFATANALPNALLMVISTGLLTGVIVPHVVAVSAQADGGRSVLPKLLTMGMVMLIAVTAVAMLLAPSLVWLFAAGFTPEQRALSTAFAYWCIPQVFFYGMFALVGEMLNARRIFAPYAWAPIVNNVVSIVGFGIVIALFGGDRRLLEDWSPVSIAVLAGTATLGIVAQTVVLLLFWRRTGIPLRFDFHWRGIGLGGLSRRASWTFATMLVGLSAGVVQQRQISAVSGDDASVFVWQNAWLVYMLPYSLVVLSIGTPYFTRISEQVTAQRYDELRADIDRAIRVLGLFIVIASAAVIAAAVPAARIFTNNSSDALASAPVLIAFLFALTPMAVLFIVQRTFYAYGDTRTPFWFSLVQATLVVLLTFLAVGVATDATLTAAVAAGQTLAGVVQVTLASWLLRRRIGAFGLAGAVGALSRFALAALPAWAAGYGVFLLSGGVDGWMLADKGWGALGTVVIGLVAIAVYVGVLALFRAPELRMGITLLRGRFGR